MRSLVSAFHSNGLYEIQDHSKGSGGAGVNEQQDNEAREGEELVQVHRRRPRIVEAPRRSRDGWRAYRANLPDQIVRFRTRCRGFRASKRSATITCNRSRARLKQSLHWTHKLNARTWRGSERRASCADARGARIPIDLISTSALNPQAAAFTATRWRRNAIAASKNLRPAHGQQQPEEGVWTQQAR